MKKRIYVKSALIGLMIILLSSANIFAQDENVVTGKVFPAGYANTHEGCNGSNSG